MQPMQAVEQSASGKGARVAAGAPSQPSQGWPKQGRATCTKNPHLPLTSALVGALCVDAVLVGTAMRHLCATLIYVCRRDGDSPAEPRLWGRSPHAPSSPRPSLTNAAVLVQHPAPLAAKAAGVLGPRAAPACLVALCGQGGQVWIQARGSCLYPGPGQHRENPHLPAHTRWLLFREAS